MTNAERYNYSILCHQEALIQFDLATFILHRSREWHKREQRRHRLHPAIMPVFKQYQPADWQQLLLEWPYVSDTDVTRLAYTRDERSGIDDRQVITTVGKYLKRHWPDIPDHVIRDAVAKYATATEFRIERTTAAIVNAVQNGPSSCMKWDDSDVDDTGHHPYEQYDPKYGWHIAIGRKNGQTIARALLMQRDNLETASKYYVRTYQQRGDESYSQPSEELTQWLQTQGYVKKNGWNGERLKFIPGPDEDDEVYAPYLDGSHQHVTLERELDADTGRYTKYLRITDQGDYDCTSNNGTAERTESCTCDDCGRRISEDDSYWVHEHEETRVGSCCIDDYTRVIGRRGNEYYVPEGDAVCVDGEYYHDEYLSDNDIVQLHDGDYAHSDNAVYIESRSEYYLHDDDDIIRDHNDDFQHIDDCVELHNGDYALEDEAWECAESGAYYLKDDVDPVEVDGELYHPDHAPEQTKTTTTTI